MTKNELLALLGSVNLMEAGTAMSYVISLPINDPRFEMAFEGSAIAAVGFWLAEKAKQGEMFTGKCLGSYEVAISITILNFDIGTPQEGWEVRFMVMWSALKHCWHISLIYNEPILWHTLKLSPSYHAETAALGVPRGERTGNW